MLYPLKNYQFNASEQIKERMRLFIRELNEDIISSEVLVFKSPTGSGKTYVMSSVFNDLCEEYENDNFCVIWACPGKGDLHLQSFEAVKKYVEGNPICTLLEDDFFGSRKFINNKEIIFVNWEKLVQKDKETDKWINNLMKDQEGMNFIDVLVQTVKNGTKIILLIDESHIGASQKTRIQEFINTIIKPEITIEMSATPLSDRPDVIVDIDDVIAEGMIKKEVIVNEGVKKEDQSLKEVESEELIMNKGYLKQEEIKSEYKKINEDVNPLTLIQIPNTDAGDAKKELIREFLREKNITEENGKLKFWCDKHEDFDKKQITKNDDITEYLVFKTAVATGWDCPRAHVLVKFRETQSEVFEIQTIGRILRTANAHSYDNDILDNAYIFTNLYSFSTTRDTYHPNKIKTQFAEMRDDYNMDIVYQQTQLDSYYKSRQGDYNSADSRFSEFFIKSFMENFEFSVDDRNNPMPDFEVNGNKLIDKGINLDLNTDDLIIEEKEMATESIDNEQNIFNDSAAAKMSEADIEAAYYAVIKENLNELAYVRSKGPVDSAIMNCFGIFYCPFSRGEKVTSIQKIVVKNKDKIAAILSDATLKFRDMLINNAGKKGVHYNFKISKVTSYSLETHTTYISPKSLYYPFYIAKKGNGQGGENQLEKDFIDYLNDNCVEWLWENGTGETKTNFGISYNNGLNTFRPDFIVKFKNGSVGIFDTKPIGREIEDTKVKAEALYQYIIDINNNRGRAPKVIGGIVVKKGSQFYYYLSKEYHDFDQNRDGWNNIEVLISAINDDIKLSKK